MNRSNFMALIGSATVLPLAARAQPASKVHRIDFLFENAQTFPGALGRIPARVAPAWLHRGEQPNHRVQAGRGKPKPDARAGRDRENPQ